MQPANEAYFDYGKRETDYLCTTSPAFSRAIKSIGHIYRPIDTDLFTGIVHQIIAQQISNTAQSAIFSRLQDALTSKTRSALSPTKIATMLPDDLRKLGVSRTKAISIITLAQKIEAGTLNLPALLQQSDAEIISTLTSLRGIGKWTAKMVLIFTLQRPNVLSYEDFGIRRALMLLHQLDSTTPPPPNSTLDPAIFEYYRTKFSPFCSVASLYLWQFPSAQSSK